MTLCNTAFSAAALRPICGKSRRRMNLSSGGAEYTWMDNSTGKCKHTAPMGFFITGLVRSYKDAATTRLLAIALQPLCRLFHHSNLFLSRRAAAYL